MSERAEVTIIVPTLAEARRRGSIVRAIESLRSAASVPVHVLAVVNGTDPDAGALADLNVLADEVLRIPQASAPLARLAGRHRTTTSFYGFLDDDDEYLPGAIDRRLAVLTTDPQTAVVISNGWRHVDGQDRLAFERLLQAAADPLHGLFDENWLASCGALFRSSSVGSEYFEAPMPYLEWTWLAWRLARSNCPIRVLDQAQFRIHETPDSASKSRAYADAHLALYQRMLDDQPPAELHRRIRRRLQNHWAVRCQEELDRGQFAEAWHSMVQVTRFPASWRYLGLAPKIIMKLLAGRLTRQALPQREIAHKARSGDSGGR